MSKHTCPSCGHTYENGNGRSEEAKAAKDRKRALAAVTALERVITNPDSVRTRLFISEPTCPMFVQACEDELMRLASRLDDPEALREIYRRNEARR